MQKLNIVYHDCEKVLDKQLNTLAKLKNKVIYIAGGTGFIGIWTATLLTYLNEHHDFNTRIFLLARNMERLHQIAPHLANNKKITLISEDVRKIFELPVETNYVLHAACTPDSRFHSLNPLETMSIIGNGTKNLLTISERCSYLESFLYLSSATIYGNQPADLKNLSENFLASAPRSNSAMSAYAESKRFAETLCTVFRSQSRLPTIIARPFSLIGPYQALDRPWAINNFIHDILHSDRIKVLGDGKTVRSYLYGSDVAFWILAMLTNADIGETFNLGSDQEIDLTSLAHCIVENTNIDAEIVFSNISTQSMQTSRSVPSIEAAKNKLKLNVTVTLQEAIQKTIEWNRLCKI